ncbi:hypothetical protein CPB83DRAFT_809035 [Crepidotus variabilis]|uniref:GTP-binding protein 2 n=1 Tax=Crepidotus variabilis TaxID=179855 RepID=A0A9P6JTA7_9AGAR|nr:hypothetical protein CPB83DRAFT_809035 [Crepidotus variabilis]
MFGESESESPRVPSPWDSFISTPPSSSPGQSVAHSPSSLSVELIPKLVAESDEGNVEYKLQLLDPSPARFARLVTQMKWRLLEGGGQAYYELGVADSGDLIGLPRAELEQSLETLEMMAGEIGASVIVVKEIEVPAILATLAKRKRISDKDGTPSSLSSTECGDSTATETETETETDSLTGTDQEDDLAMTVVLRKPSGDDSGHTTIFSMDSEPEDTANTTDDERLNSSSSPRVTIDLEISSVFKPRPMKARIHNHPNYAHLIGGKNKRAKKNKDFIKDKYTHNRQTSEEPMVRGGEKPDKATLRRQGRDRRRDEKKKTLEARATQGIETVRQVTITQSSHLVPSADETETLVQEMGDLHVALVEEPLSLSTSLPMDSLATAVATTFEDFEDDSDVFGSPTRKTGLPSFPTFTGTSGESHLDVDAAAIAGAIGVDVNEGAEDDLGVEKRLIVEALVVRKMSLEEAFLDFGGFSLI